MICDVCQTPIGDDVDRTVAGEPAHPECLEGDITPGDVEGVREEVFNDVPEGATDEYRAGWIDAVIEFDRRLTDPEFYRDVE